MELQIILQLFLAALFGGVIGLEREIKKRGAGLQTFSLVSLGSCIFTIIAVYFSQIFAQEPGLAVDVSRVVQAVAIGIGFIGAGTIFKSEKGVEGLTTAAGLWIVSGIGIAVGAGFYSLAFLATLLSLVILAGFGMLEKKFFQD